MKSKRITDIVAMVMVLCAIITGFKLHREVHHLFPSDNNAGLWVTHIIAGGIVVACLIAHCIQHKYWFKNYVKIPVVRKGVTTLLFAFAILVAVSGTILVFGSHSVSIFHYITAIAFTLLAITHVTQCWKIFKVLFKQR